MPSLSTDFTDYFDSKIGQKICVDLRNLRILLILVAATLPCARLLSLRSPQLGE